MDTVKDPARSSYYVDEAFYADLVASFGDWQRDDFYNLLSRIQAMCESCAHCSVAVQNYFSSHTVVVRMLVQTQ